MAKNSILKKIVIALSAIGPGIFMIGYNIGTGSITTLISAGSTYQMHLLWVLLIACFVTYVMLIAYQQFTLVTGVTSMRAYRRHLPLGKLIAIFIIASMSLGEFVGIAGITGIVSNLIKEWTALLFNSTGINPLVSAVTIAVGSFIFLWNGKYTKFEKFLIFFVVLMGISFIMSLFITKDPSAIFTTLKPAIPENTGGGASALLLIASIAGTTAGAILYVMRSTVVAEKGWTVKDLKQARKDAFWSALLMFILSATIMALATANTDGPVTKVVDMMYVLSSNKFLMSVFVIGVVSAGISTIFPIALILPWLISDYTGTSRDVKRPMYRILGGLALLVALTVPVFGGRPVAVLILAGAIQIIVLPIATVAILYLLNNKKLMGKHTAGRWLNAGLVVTLLYSIFTTYAGTVSSYEEISNYFGSKKGNTTVTTVFTKDKNKYVFHVKQFGLPENWEKAEYLELELKLSDPARIGLMLNTGHGPSEITLLPASNARLKIDVPLTFYRKPNTEGSEMAALFSRSRPTGWYNIWGVNCGPLDRIDSIGFIINSPLEKVQLDIYSLTLANTPHDEFIEPAVLVDKFGQWIPAKNDKKVRSLRELKAAWQKDDKKLADTEDLDRDKYGGFNNTKQKATGFFYTKKIDGKWWFVDPLGNLFLATGINGVSPGDYTRTKQRKYIFEEIPPVDFQKETEDAGSPLVSFGEWNQKRRFGNNWKSKWKELAVKRMQTWGFNAINWSVPYLNDAVVYTKFLKGWGIEEGVMGFPDVYSKEFLARADKVAKEQCLPLREDPWMLGYFIGNEPVWPGMESRVADAILESDKLPEMKKALQAFLKKGDTPERRKEFIHQSFIKFLNIINNAIKRYDPNHLTLGIRFGGDLNMEDKVIKMADIFDVFSFNAYLTEVSHKKLDRVAKIMDKPILIGEFHFGVPGNGLNGGLQPVKNQQARADAYKHYVETAFSHPNVVSTFWYRWRDQPNTGRSDGENYNIGFVNVLGLQYDEIVNAAVKTHKHIFDTHRGTKN